MTAISIEQAQADLTTLIARMKPGEEYQIVQDGRTVARLVGASPAQRKPRRPGSAVGRLEVVQDDDAHLGDFGDYMP